MAKVPPAAGASLRFVDDDVVDMQMRAAHQGMNRAHPQHPHQPAIAERPDQLVAAVALPPPPVEERLRVEVRAQLGDDGKRRRPFARLEAADMHLVVFGVVAQRLVAGPHFCDCLK